MALMFVMCLGLLLAPPAKIALYVKSVRIGKVWPRILGFIGIVLVVLVFMSNPLLNTFNFSPGVVRMLKTMKHIIGGISLGMVIAMLTEKSDVIKR
jgi:hypothetical protein